MRAKPTTETRSRTRRARGKAIPLSELARARTVSGTVMVVSSVPLEIAWTDRRDSSEGSVIQGRRGSSGQVRRQNLGVIRVEIAQLKSLNPRYRQQRPRAIAGVLGQLQRC